MSKNRTHYRRSITKFPVGKGKENSVKLGNVGDCVRWPQMGPPVDDASPQSVAPSIARGAFVFCFLLFSSLLFSSLPFPLLCVSFLPNRRLVVDDNERRQQENTKRAGHSSPRRESATCSIWKSPKGKNKKKTHEPVLCIRFFSVKRGKSIEKSY